jgi:PDZ domain-containing secreted protein
LLVVRAPEDETLKLEDGDVIQSIDGREPNSVSHAMRILGSYQSGEELELQIMRDKRKQKLKIEMPDNRSSWMPHVAPGVGPDPKVVRKVHIRKPDRT